MDPFGKAAWTMLLVGCVMLLCAGCAEKPAGKFETYGNLKKSTPEIPTDSGTVKKTDAVPVLTSTPPAETKNVSSPSPAPTQIAAKPPSQTPVPPKAASTALKSGTNVIDAGLQASITTSAPKSGAVPVSATSTDRKVQLLVPERNFKTEGPEGAWRVSYDDIDLLKVLNMDPVPPNAATVMPAWLKGLEGKRIRIRGFMYPTFSQTGIHAFALARDNQICCFGRNPKIYDVFDVMLREGVTTNYLPNRPFDVVGVFHIRPEEEAGKLFHLYDMDDATVIAK
jgi:hypothetical protein